MNKEELKEYNKQYYKDNREYFKQYHKDNREVKIEHNKQWLKDNPEYKKQYRKNNEEKIAKHDKQYRKDNEEKIAKRMKRYYKDNRKHLKQYGEQYRNDNPKRIKEYRSQWVKDNPDYQKQWVNEHPDYYNNYQKYKCKTDLKYNLNRKISRAIGISLKRTKSIKSNKNGRHWELLVDYTLADLIKRLNKTMPLGYTWQDYLSGELHIDHIIPVSAFNFTKPEHTDFKRCWALSNLRLLPVKENLIKYNHLDRPFQPALKI